MTKEIIVPPVAVKTEIPPITIWIKCKEHGAWYADHQFEIEEHLRSDGLLEVSITFDPCPFCTGELEE